MVKVFVALLVTVRSVGYADDVNTNTTITHSIVPTLIALDNMHIILQSLLRIKHVIRDYIIENRITNLTETVILAM